MKKKKLETRGRKPTLFPTKQVRVPIQFEKEVKDYIDFLKQRKFSNE